MFKTFISILLWPMALFVFVICAFIYILLTFFIQPQKLYLLVNFFCRLILLVAGQWLKVEGTVPPKSQQPYLYLFNHESLLDAFMMGGAIRHYITAVGAEFQFSYPVWGTILRRHGVIPIKREKLGDAIHSLDQAEAAIHKGLSLIISPEGTRTLSGAIGGFKKGPFHVALNTGVTIVPVALFGAYSAKKKSDWRLSPGILTVRFGDPIYKEEYKNMDLSTLQNFVRSKIVNLLEQKKKGENES